VVLSNSVAGELATAPADEGDGYGGYLLKTIHQRSRRTIVAVHHLRKDHHGHERSNDKRTQNDAYGYGIIKATVVKNYCGQYLAILNPQ
jgi:hypothetical protein